ncbi:hypothetical protein TNCV_276881 [Trichonephila clavipes]|uniref:Uncharacterized protein n=1 Tax=Trichonephila clavipes TaxID=2585209 RepID=A0A8X6S7I2_TRICX|nr:hypothetical protein TNCV_276881 [Trichonephila clavipes]
MPQNVPKSQAHKNSSVGTAADLKSTFVPFMEERSATEEGSVEHGLKTTGVEDSLKTKKVENKTELPHYYVAAVTQWSRYRIVVGMSRVPANPPCRGAMHVKSVESSDVLPLVW